MAHNFGLCEHHNLAVELLLATIFVLTVMFIEVVFFTPFEYILTFTIKKPWGYSNATLSTMLKARFAPLLVALLMYIPVINLFTVVIEWQEHNLLFAVLITTALVKVGILFLYPLLIKPIFEKKVPFPEDGESKLLL